VSLKEYQTRGKIHRRLLIHPDHALRMKSFEGSVQPKKVDLSPALCEWTLEAIDTPVLPKDKDRPSWYNIDGVYIGEYQTWQDAVQKVLPLYALPEDFTTNLSPEMVKLVQKWTESTEDVQQRALLALRFVQDEVKYLGFHDEIGGWKPTDPRVVLERRFGDCKDKSVLLHSLLKLMNISSTPVLVDTNIGKRLPELLPRPFLNHAILRIEITGSDYWVDPTFTQQGGSLKDNYCPEYYWGLVISPQTTELLAIPSPTTKPIEVKTSIKLTSPETAELKIERTGYGYRADRMRRNIQQIGLKKISKNRLEYVQKQYKGASIGEPISIIDDREKNVLTITYSYQVSTRTRAGKKLLKASSATLDEYLNDGINLERTSPYALEYPLWVKEHIHIENPFNEWAHDIEEAAFDNEAIQYGYQMKKEGHTADFHFELKHLQDYVPVDLIQDYWNIVQEVEPNPSLEVVITAPIPKS
jgi:transglutaminase-like putative cysteine protease